MPTSTFDDTDLAQLRSRGISIDEVQHQLLCFRNPPNYVDIVRPCTIEDGVRQIPPSDHEELLELHRRAADSGRMMKFVPASGAATRMFRSLYHYLDMTPERRPPWNEVVARAGAGDGRAEELIGFVRNLDRFAFAKDVRAVTAARGQNVETLVRDGDYAGLLEALLTRDGLGYGSLPKGLIAFHSYGTETRTAFEEHLVEAAHTVREHGGLCRLHLTVSPEHLDQFASLMREVGSRYAERYSVGFDVSYSVQKPATDTVAVDLEDRPFRTERGKILFRPGGHGALIENLDDLEADIVFIKNIDNVQTDRELDTVHLWKRLLAGHLVRVQARTFDFLHRIKSSSGYDPDVVEETLEFVGREFGVEPPRTVVEGPVERRRAYLIDRLERPIRVCGVVANTGEPGGGPFWVRGNNGDLTPQIVETGQVDPDSDDQQRRLAASTHFNPVDLVCGLRDGGGSAYALHPLVDADAVIVTRKSSGGRDLKALERPGLWNGAMAGWNTVFVEVPLATFSPVKTVTDLLRPEHQA